MKFCVQKIEIHCGYGFIKLIIFSFRKLSNSSKKLDKYQRIQNAKLILAKKQEEELKDVKPNEKVSIDLNMRIPERFKEPRKKALVTFFIRHFIDVAKKSNEFRAYGKSLLLVAQSQNLLTLLDEMGYGESKECRNFHIELEKLRNICRVGIEGYFKVNYGYEEKLSKKDITSKQDSFRVDAKKQTLPLPELPLEELRSSPILGIEDVKRVNVAFVEVHEVVSGETSTDL